MNRWTNLTLLVICVLIPSLFLQVDSKKNVFDVFFNVNKPTKTTNYEFKMKNKIFQSRGGSSTSFNDETSSNQQQPNHNQSKNPYSYITDTSHYTSATDLLQQLQVSSTQGLSKHQVQLRHDLLGPNAIKLQSSDPFWKLLLEQFDDRLVQTLVGVAIFSASLASFEQNLQSFIEPIVIMTCLLINAFVGVMHAKSAEGSLDALKKLQPSVCCVLRDHVWLNDYPSAELVIGDMILLRVGSKVPADARLVSFYTSTFTVDESSLTGESLPVLKSTESVNESTGLSGRTCMVYSSTMVTSGSALAVVTGTGSFTEIGQISAGVEEAREHHMKTPLAEKLDVFSSHLSKIVLGICALVFVSNIPKFNDKSFNTPLQGAIHYLKIAVALGVAAIPEGLPAVVALCLSLGTRRMAARNVIVRRLASVETLGCTSVICTDKTGTLTTNRMVVKTLITFSAISLKHLVSANNDMNKKEQVSEIHPSHDIGSTAIDTIQQYKSVDAQTGDIVKITSSSSSGDHMTHVDAGSSTDGNAIKDNIDIATDTVSAASTAKSAVFDSYLDSTIATAKDLDVYHDTVSTVMNTSAETADNIRVSNNKNDDDDDDDDSSNNNNTTKKAKKGDDNIYHHSDIDIIASDDDSSRSSHEIASISGGYSTATSATETSTVSSTHTSGSSGVHGSHRDSHRNGDSQGGGIVKSTLLSSKHHQHHHHTSTSSSDSVYGVERSVGGDSYNPFQGSINIAASDSNTKSNKDGSKNKSSSSSNSNQQQSIHSINSSASSGTTTSSWHDISLICAMCNQAEVELVPSTTIATGHHSESHTAAEYKAVGEPTEAALRVLVEKIGIGKLHQHYIPVNGSTAADLTSTSSSASSATVLNARECSDYWSRMYHRLAILEFTRERKRMSVLCRNIEHDHMSVDVNSDNRSKNDHSKSSSSSSSSNNKRITNRLLVKGAAEMVIEKCTFIKLEDGSIIPITPTVRQSLQSLVAELASRPLRCVALAYSEKSAVLGRLSGVTSQDEARECLTAHSQPSSSSSSSTTTTSSNQQSSPSASLSSSSIRNSHNHNNHKHKSVSDVYDGYEDELVLVGICGIRDPPRPLVADSMALSRTAGVRVMMITGDSKDTAVAIAREIGIFQSSSFSESIEDDSSNVTVTDDSNFLATSAFTTKEFFAKSRTEQLTLLKSGNKVFCRAEPRDKQILITMLEQLGEVTAMTGDGVNDAPALKQADIGIAMGIAGTEVAKQAADMILADDDFNSILAAVEEGRNIYNNMQAFVSFLLSCNIGEIAAILLSSVLGIPTPLSPLHLLWVNLVTDGPPATALGFNPPDPLCMTRPPRPRHDSLLTPWLLTRYCITGAYVGLATIAAFVWWFTERDISFMQLLRHSNEVASATYYLSSGGLAYPQSLSLSVLVVIEMLKALSAVSLNQSLFVVPPWRNPYLLLSVGVSFSLHVLLLQTPMLAALFGLHGLTRRDWLIVLALSLPVLLLEEGLKWIGRRVQQDQQPTKLSSLSSSVRAVSSSSSQILK